VGLSSNLLEVIRYLGGGIRFFSAGSSECFGQTGREPATDETPLRPRSPYAVAKASAYWQVATYRQAYGMFACTGILANHESPLRPKRFWGWAPDYVQAMALMLQAEKPADYLIASGTTTCLRNFAQAAFAAADLDLADHLESVGSLKRPADLAYSAMDPSRIAAELGWVAKRPIQEIVEKMYREELY
jgi:GDPmannose 4,6-dehydratase